MHLSHSPDLDTPSIFVEDTATLASRLDIFFINCPWPVQVSYSGGGDSGQLDATCFLLPEEVVPRQDQLDLLEALRDIFEEMTWVAVDQEHGGWENNEGGEGKLTIRPDGTCELEHGNHMDEYVSTVLEDRWRPLLPHEVEAPSEALRWDTLHLITDEFRTALQQVFAFDKANSSDPLSAVRVGYSMECGGFDLYSYWCFVNPNRPRTPETERPPNHAVIEDLLRTQAEALLQDRQDAELFPPHDEDMINGDLIFTPDGMLEWNINAGTQSTQDSCEPFLWKTSSPK